MTPLVGTIPNLDGSGSTTAEPLGTQIMFGATVVGQKMTSITPAGNGGPITTVRESWIDSRNGIMVLQKSSNSSLAFTTTMQNYSNAEPDLALFHIPEGYQTVDESGKFAMTVPRAKQNY